MRNDVELYTSLIPTMIKMKNKALLLLSVGAIAQDVNYAQFVNPFIGSEGAIPGYACM